MRHQPLLHNVKFEILIKSFHCVILEHPCPVPTSDFTHIYYSTSHSPVIYFYSTTFCSRFNIWHIQLFHTCLICSYNSTKSSGTLLSFGERASIIFVFFSFFFWCVVYNSIRFSYTYVVITITERASGHNIDWCYHLCNILTQLFQEGAEIVGYLWKFSVFSLVGWKLLIRI